MRRLVFLGTPEAAARTLRALVEGGHDVALVVTAPDRRRARRAGASPTPVKAVATELGIPVTERVEEAVGAGASLGVVVAFVADLDLHARGDDALLADAALDDAGRAEHRLELADTRLHLPLGVFGRVVVAILRQVAEHSSGLDLAGDLHPAARRQVLEFSDKARMSYGGQLRLCHALEATGWRKCARQKPVKKCSSLSAGVSIPRRESCVRSPDSGRSFAGVLAAGDG